MTRLDRILATIEEALEELKPIKDALLDDGMEDYADAIQDTMNRLSTLITTLTNQEVTEEMR